MVTRTPVSDLKEHDEPFPGDPDAGHPVKEEEETSVLDLLIVIAERKRVVFWVTVGFAVLAIVISLLLPVRYTASVVLMPPQQNNSLSAQLASQFSSMGSMAALATGGTSSLLKSPNDMYVAMLRSQTVENGMIDHYGLMREYHKKLLSDARKKFEHYATIDGNGKDGLIHISFVDGDPHRAAELANGYVDQFRALSQNLAITEAGQRRLFFEQQLQQANQNLGNAEEALKATEQKTGVIQLDSQARALIESAAQLRAQLAAKEVQIQGMQTYATGENAQLVEAQQELDSLRTQLAKLGGSGDSADSIIVPKGQMTQASLEYVRKLRDVKYYETIFDILARQFELAKLDEAKEGALIQVVDPAIPPDKKSSPQRALIVILATLVGLFIGVLTALVLAGFERMNQDPDASQKLSRFRYALLRQSRQNAAH